MNLLMIPGEAMFLTFKLADGSGYLTSHRLILIEHEPGQLDTADPKFYYLKNSQKTQINNGTLTAHFKINGKAKIQLSLNTPSLLQEIKQYIEETAKIRLKSEATNKSLR